MGMQLHVTTAVGATILPTQADCTFSNIAFRRPWQPEPTAATAKLGWASYNTLDLDQQVSSISEIPKTIAAFPGVGGSELTEKFGRSLLLLGISSRMGKSRALLVPLRSLHLVRLMTGYLTSSPLTFFNSQTLY